ncbi:TPA: Abi family protein, partial [Staphylococcus aureus]|nr:Abi family protein [Staphylococcus aureus]HBE8243845.1 Abi family protein [Staphylococcus aureus]HBG3193386.1 Abi family protein [Staphylococcus aureus]HBG3196193.1 Abi family protein [Staphylococcus aureus]HCJ4445143.1 Abi family protein [Staphylococcus aureus]
YNNKPSTLFYLDKDLYFEKVNDEYKYSAKKLKEFNRLQNVFWRAIEKKKSNDNVKHNIKKYNIIPAWVLFQNFSFGDLSTFYRTTLPTYRNKVSKRIENLIEKNTGISIKLPEKLLCAWLNSIRFLRNRIAHTDIIYGINFTNTCAKHHSDEEMYVNIEKYKYQQRLVTFLLAMKKIFMSMPENNIIEWNETLTKIENKCSEHNFIKLSRLGVIENNLSYFKITK